MDLENIIICGDNNFKQHIPFNSRQCPDGAYCFIYISPPSSSLWARSYDCKHLKKEIGTAFVLYKAQQNGFDFITSQ